MRKTLTFLFLVFSLSQAQDYMRIKMKDGSTQMIQLQSINKITFSDVTGVDDITMGRLGGIIKTFALLQNYPNPFNPATTIDYTIPSTDVVTIRVYDITGRLVRSLASGVQTTGEHQARWDSKDNAGQTVASGIYIYEIQFQGSVLARKMMLLK